MKKILTLILAWMLASVCLTCPAAAENLPEAGKPAELYDLWEKRDGESVRLGSCVPVASGTLLTSAALIPDSPDNLTVSDGETVWEVKAVIPDSTGLLATVLCDQSESASGYGVWTVMPYGMSVAAGDCVVRAAAESGGREEIPVLSAISMDWHDNRCLLLSLEKDAPLGSPVLTPEGELAGILVAEYAEGAHRAVALPTEEIARCLLEASGLLTNVSSWTQAPEGFRVTTEGNRVTFDWSEMTLPEKAEGETVWLVVADAGNNYLNFFPAETEARSATLLLTPGRIYLSGITCSQGVPGGLPESAEVTALPAAKRLTAHGFRSLLCAVAEMPEGEDASGRPPVPVEEVTEELLRSGRAYFYSASAYEVEETLPSETLLVTLTDPDGNNYRYESSWVYGPEYMQEDIWYLPLTGTGLTAALDQNGYPRGVYSMAFYVGGELADTLSFELK